MDVVIIGGGPAGSITARALCRLGHKVLIVDGSLAENKISFGESLPGAAREILSRLDMLDVLDESSHLPAFGNYSAWGTKRISHMDFINDVRGHGWLLDRPQFNRTLLEKAVESGTHILKSKVRSFQTMNTGWEIDVDDDRIQAKWIVDATGRTSWFAQNIGNKRLVIDDVSVLACQVLDTGPSHRSTCVESRPEGWWYTCRIPDNKRVVILNTHSTLANRLQSNIEYFWSMIDSTVHLKSIVAKCEAPSEIHSLSAGSARLNSFSGHRWLAVGDSAISLDPLSAQGLFNSLASGYSAGLAIHKSLNGDQTAILNYGRTLENVWNIYLDRLTYFYAIENRWPSSVFWANRFQVPTAIKLC